MKNLKKILACGLALTFALSVASCKDKGDTSSPSSSVPDPVVPQEVNIDTSSIEKDYVYLTYRERDDEQEIHVQAPDYMLDVVAAEGSIKGVQPISYGEKHYVGQDFDVIAGASMDFYAETSKGTVHATGMNPVQNSSASSSGRFWRLLEGGKYKQKFDVLKMVYDNDNSIYGRLEIVAYQSSFSIGYDIFSVARLRNTAISFVFRSSVYNAYAAEKDGRVVTLENSSGDGLAFILPADGSVTAEQEEEGNGVKFSSVLDTVPLEDLTGFSVNVVPVLKGDLSRVDEVLAREEVSASVSRLMPEVVDSVNTKYEDGTGTILIDGNFLSSGPRWNYYTDASDFNAYDKFEIKLKNDSDVNVTCPVSVLINTTLLNSADNVFGTYMDASLVGQSSFICDVNDVPLGKPVQVSKNWHSFANSAVEKIACTYTGQWYVGTVYLEVPANGEATYHYVTAYAKWGEVESASHSQLCLIGWDGYDLWEQLALGNYGENICYHVNGGSWAQDIRPLKVKNHHGNMVKYSWSGNVGGMEFLRYHDYLERERELVDVISDFRSQGPNMTETDYYGYTSDGKIYAAVTSNLVRTDDVTRIIYNIEYTVVEDINFTRLTLFQYATERYQANYYRKYAYGNANGVIKEDNMLPRYTDEFCDGYIAQQIDVEGSDPWFYLYDFDAEMREETSAVAYIVRDYEATLNGKTYTAPTFNYRKAGEQLSFELTAPKDAGRKIVRGSKFDMTIEVVVLPTDPATYYGDCDYFDTSIFNTSAQALQQASAGAVEVSAATGKVLSSYPVTIASASGEVAAEFTIKGGLGYVPMKITGLDGYDGYTLQVKDGGEWVDVDQSVKGNDFWQCGYDRASGKYYLVYNVKNVTGTNFGASHTYRLISK